MQKTFLKIFKISIDQWSFLLYITFNTKMTIVHFLKGEKNLWINWETEL